MNEEPKVAAFDVTYTAANGQRMHFVVVAADLAQAADAARRAIDPNVEVLQSIEFIGLVRDGIA